MLGLGLELELALGARCTCAPSRLSLCYTPYHATIHSYRATPLTMLQPLTVPLFLDEVRALAPLAAGEVVTYSYLAEEQLCAPYAERAALLQVRVRVRVGVWVSVWVTH